MVRKNRLEKSHWSQESRNSGQSVRQQQQQSNITYFTYEPKERHRFASENYAVYRSFVPRPIGVGRFPQHLKNNIITIVMETFVDDQWQIDS